MCVIYSVAYCFEYVRVYTGEHTWVTASKWMYENIPNNSIICVEHWDDRLPVHVPDVKSRHFEHRVLQMYDTDKESVFDKMCRDAVPDLPAACLEDAALPYLSKFKGTLAPEQMAEDLVLAPAADNKAYRESVVTW